MREFDNSTIPRQAVEALLNWFREHGKKFPWRGEVGWYGVLVAEFLLIRTRRKVAERAFYEILSEYPDPRLLCRAGPASIEPYFRKIGLPARARRLWETTCRILLDYGGSPPCDYGELLNLPGVGDYIARVLLSRVCGEHVAFADANVVRVLSRLLGKRLSPGEATEVLEKSVERGRLLEVNTAIIDLAENVCQPRRRACGRCPLRDCCVSAVNPG